MYTNRLIENEHIVGALVEYESGKTEYVSAAGLGAVTLVDHIVENHDENEIKSINVEYVFD
jgi:hypothetical protein